MRKAKDKTAAYSGIGKRIQARLDVLGKGQPWLAGQLKISQSAVSQMLRNPHPSKHLPKIAGIIGSPYDWLAHGKGPDITPEWSLKSSDGGMQSAPYTGKHYDKSGTPLQEATRFVNDFADSFSSLGLQAKKIAATMILSAIKEFTGKQ